MGRNIESIKSEIERIEQNSTPLNIDNSVMAVARLNLQLDEAMKSEAATVAGIVDEMNKLRREDPQAGENRKPQEQFKTGDLEADAILAEMQAIRKSRR